MFQIIKLHSNDIEKSSDILYDFIYIEGIINNKNVPINKLQKYHNKYFNNNTLNKIRNYFYNNII
jgi:hypothetical protein